jgi:hypothetical protein
MDENKTTTEREEFDLEDWLEKGVRGLRDRLKSKRPQIFPEEFKKHTRAARKEMLLAVRSLLDQAIEEVEKEPEPAKKGTKTKIDVH